jgi:alpha-L-arabinofuranosidase
LGLTVVEAHLELGARAEADISPGLFGGMIEHFGRGLYGGVWDSRNRHPRSDVLAAVQAMGVTALRYPGGCFSDWYHWRDGIGPRSERPAYPTQFWTDGLSKAGIAIDPALERQFGPPETNAFGTDEFLRYCSDVDAEPLLSANFGTGTPEEAAEWVAYVNRRPESPARVRWWFIGNETYGRWELGHCSAAEYGSRFREYAAAMREVDPDVKLIAVGDAPRGGSNAWNREMLAAAGDAVDMVSLHYYFPSYTLDRELADDEAEFLQLLRGARQLGATLDQTLAGIAPLPIALDEWNLWTAWRDLIARNHRLCDSVYFGGCLNRMIERADRVRFAMISHLVNVMAPIQTSEDRMHVTAAYLTLLLYRSSVRRHAVELGVDVPAVEVTPLHAKADARPLGGTMGAAAMIPRLDAVATADDGGTAVLLCAGTVDEPLRVTIDGLPPSRRGRARWLDGPSPWAVNDHDAPTRLGFGLAPCETDTRGRCTVELRPATVTALTFDHEDNT